MQKKLIIPKKNVNNNNTDFPQIRKYYYIKMSNEIAKWSRKSKEKRRILNAQKFIF